MLRQSPIHKISLRLKCNRCVCMWSIDVYFGKENKNICLFRVFSCIFPQNGDHFSFDFITSESEWHISGCIMLNIIDLIFIYFTATIIILAIGINMSEDNLPTALLQTFRYGKHAYRGSPSRLVTTFEIPKSYFKHFYVFAIVWAICIFYLCLSVYAFGTTVPEWIIDALDLLCGSNRVATSEYLELLSMLYCSFVFARFLIDCRWICSFFSFSFLPANSFIVDNAIRGFIVNITMCSSLLRNAIHSSILPSEQNQFHPLHCRLLSLFWSIFGHHKSSAGIQSESTAKWATIFTRWPFVSIPFVIDIGIFLCLLSTMPCQSHAGQFTKKSKG